MGPELDLKPKPEVSIKASSVCKENTCIQPNPQENLLLSASNNRDVSVDMEPSPVIQTTKSDRIENKEIKITDVTQYRNGGTDESGGTETTETSSSFGDTESGTEDGLVGDEVQSQLRGEQNSMYDFDGYYDVFRTRNKKLTAHWKKFVRPLMWRCKWMELRMKELQSQALKYDKELAGYDERKNSDVGRSTSETLDVSNQSRRNKLMKRKRRNRVEEMVDIELYMSQHNFFSYYENKKFLTDGASAEVDIGFQGEITDNNNEFGTNEGFSLDSRDEGSSFEALFRNLESLQSRVRQLISRVDVVFHVNSGKIPSMNNLCSGIPQNALSNSSQHPNLSPGHRNGLKVEPLCITSQNVPGQNLVDLLMLDRSLLNHGEITPRSELNGSTIHFQVGDLIANTEEVLIDNEQAKEELQDFEKFRDQFGEKSHVSEEKVENPPPLSETDSPSSKRNVKAKAKKRKRSTGSRR